MVRGRSPPSSSTSIDLPTRPLRMMTVSDFSGLMSFEASAAIDSLDRGRVAQLASMPMV
jgi:hypothetical protein